MIRELSVEKSLQVLKVLKHQEKSADPKMFLNLRTLRNKKTNDSLFMAKLIGSRRSLDTNQKETYPKKLTTS